MIENAVNRVTYKGDGITTEFAIPFEFIDKEDIVVVVVDPDKNESVLQSDYFIDTEKKTVTYPGYPVGEEPPETERPAILQTGWSLVIYRDIEVTQESSLGDTWPFNVIEKALDKLTMICQDTLYSARRKLKLPESAGDDVDPTLPFPTPGSSIYWNEEGKKLVSGRNPDTAATEAEASAAAAKASETAAAESEEHAAASEAASKASETAAAESESNAADSEQAAKASETAAAESEANAAASEKAAAASQTAAATSEINASASETAAKASETAAAKSQEITLEAASSALQSSNAAEASEQAAAASAEAARSSETAAARSEASAAASASAAKESETAAAQSQTSAASSASAAKASETAAAQSQSSAASSASAAKASETAAAQSQSSAASSASAAKSSETAAAQSKTSAASSASEAALSATKAEEAAAGVGNPVSDVVEVNGKVTVTKSNGDKNEFFAGLNMLQRNKAYAVGDIAYSPNLKSYEYLECITAGTTGDTEPDFSETQTGGVISDGTAQFQIVDQKQDGTDIDALKTELEAVKSSLAAVQTAISDAQNFAIIYPNGGKSSSPASVKVNTRYVENNPFPGYMVMCYPQIKVNNQWGYSGWYEGDSYGAMGVKANLLLPDDKVIVQTGRSYCLGPSYGSGNPFGNANNLSSVPCRVLVYKLGKI